MESKLQKLLALERENTQLRQLLQSTPQATGKIIVARLLAVALNPATQQVVVDRGVQTISILGQPVLDAYGVLGQVVSIGPLTSRVLLVTDIQSSVPVQNYRTGARAIAIGSGNSGQLRLINFPDNSDIQEGDLYVASGMGLRFPVGYPVGVVAKSTLRSGERFATIPLIPAAASDKSEQVLLAWPEHRPMIRQCNNSYSSGCGEKDECRAQKIMSSLCLLCCWHGSDSDSHAAMGQSGCDPTGCWRL